MAIVDEAGVLIEPEGDGFAARLRAEVSEAMTQATAGQDRTVTINIDTDVDRAEANVREAMAKMSAAADAFTRVLGDKVREEFQRIPQLVERTRLFMQRKTLEFRNKVNEILRPFYKNLRERFVEFSKRLRDFRTLGQTVAQGVRRSWGDMVDGMEARLRRARGMFQENIAEPARRAIDSIRERPIVERFERMGRGIRTVFNNLRDYSQATFRIMARSARESTDSVVEDFRRTGRRIGDALEPLQTRFARLGESLRQAFTRSRSAITDTETAVRQTDRATADFDRSLRRLGVTANDAADQAVSAFDRVTASEDRLTTARNKGEVAALRRLASEEALTRAEAEHERTGARLIDAEGRLEALYRRTSASAAAVEEAERAVTEAREAHSRATENYFNVESKVITAREAAERAARSAADAERAHAQAVDESSSAHDRAAGSIRNHERSHRGLRGAITATASALSNQGRQISSVGDVLQNVGRRFSLFGRVARGVGGVLSGLGQITQGLSGIMTGSAGAADLLKGGVAGAAGAAAQLTGALIQVAAKAALFAVIAGAVTFAVGALGAAFAGLPALMAGGIASFAVFKLGMDGITNAYNNALKPALEELGRQVSDVFEARLTPVFQNLANNLIPQITENMKNLANAFSDGAEQIVNMVTQGENVEKIRAIIDKTATAVRAELNPALVNLVQEFINVSAQGDVLQNMVGIFGDLIQNTADWLAEMRQIGALEPAVAALRSALDSVVKALFDVLTGATQFFTAAEPGFSALATSIGDIARQVLPDLGSAFGDVMQAASELLDSIPPETWDEIGRAVQDLGQAVLELAQNDSFQQFAQAVIDGSVGVIDALTVITDTLRVLGDAVTATYEFFRPLLDTFKEINSGGQEWTEQYNGQTAAIREMGGAAEAARPPIDDVGSASEAAAEKAAAAGRTAGSAFDPVAPGAEAAGQGIKDGIEPPAQQVPTTVNDAMGQVDFSPVLTAAQETFGQLPTAVSDGVNQAVTAMDTGGEQLRTSAETAGRGATEALRTSLADAPTVVRDLMGQARDALSEAGDAMKQAAETSGQGVSEALRTSMEQARQAVEQGAEAITTAIEDAAQAVSTAGQNIAQSVEQSTGDAATSAETNFQRVSTAADTAMGEVEQRVQTAMQQVQQKIDETMRQSTQSVEQGMDRIVQAFETGGQQSVRSCEQTAQQIAQTFQELAEQLYQAGVAMMERLAAGITAGGASAVAAAEGVASQIAGAFPQSPAKWGPLSGSGDPLRSGGRITSRLADGIAAQGSEVAASLSPILAAAAAQVAALAASLAAIQGGQVTAARPGAGSGGPTTRVDHGSVPSAVWDRLRSMGYKGRPGDGREALYVPRQVLEQTRGGGARADGAGGGADQVMTFEQMVAAFQEAMAQTRMEFAPGTSRAMAQFVNRGNTALARQ